MKRVVLASQSFWRKELLTWMGIAFEVRVSGFDERAVKETDPEKLVAMLAFGKAMAARDKWLLEYGNTRDVVFVGADTVIVLPPSKSGGKKEDEEEVKIIGKPKDLDQAREILKLLRGREHRVYTGVCVVSGEDKLVEVEVTRIKFRKFSDRELEKYLETGESLGKAGGYQILSKAGDFVEEMEGSVTGVVGLPLGRLGRMLARVGVATDVDVKAMLRRRIGCED